MSHGACFPFAPLPMLPLVPPTFTIFELELFVIFFDFFATFFSTSVATAIADVFRKNCLFRLLKLAKIVGIFDKILDRQDQKPRGHLMVLRDWSNIPGVIQRITDQLRSAIADRS